MQVGDGVAGAPAMPGHGRGAPEMATAPGVSGTMPRTLGRMSRTCHMPAGLIPHTCCIHVIEYYEYILVKTMKYNSMMPTCRRHGSSMSLTCGKEFRPLEPEGLSQYHGLTRPSVAERTKGPGAWHTSASGGPGQWSATLGRQRITALADDGMQSAQSPHVVCT